MHYIMRRISTITRCTSLYRSDHFKEKDLNPYHHSYILIIARRPGISQDEIAKELCINKSNVTRSLAQLEENGYIKRIPSQKDKRITEVYPTDKLEAILPHVREIAHNWNVFLTEDISAEDMEVFHAVLERIYEKAKSYTKEVKNP